MKKKMKKVLMSLFAVSLCAILVVACAGEGVTPVAPVRAGADVGIVPPVGEIDTDEGEAEDYLTIEDDAIDLSGQNDDMINGEIDEYFSITGIIVSIEERDGLKRLEIEDTNGNPAVLVLNDDTEFPFSADFSVGDEVTGWYPTNMPMIMIWPPEYNISTIIPADKLNEYLEDALPYV